MSRQKLYKIKEKAVQIAKNMIKYNKFLAIGIDIKRGGKYGKNR